VGDIGYAVDAVLSNNPLGCPVAGVASGCHDSESPEPSRIPILSERQEALLAPRIDRYEVRFWPVIEINKAGMKKS
jgi:hypothetical protein